MELIRSQKSHPYSQYITAHRAYSGPPSFEVLEGRVRTKLRATTPPHQLEAAVATRMADVKAENDARAEVQLHFCAMFD